jgi:2,7-dihydroxy-5-methyl-1-naphthoate 7-O-methyltransferase
VTQARELQAMAGLATPMAVRVAATLGLVDRAGPAGATAERLAGETGTQAPVLRRLLDHLVTVGVFAQNGDTYRPTDLGNQMRADAPDGIKLQLDINSAGGRAELAFVDLLATITTGEPAYPRRYGRGFWADLDATPALRRSFDAQMNRRFRVQTAQIAERYDWGASRTSSTSAGATAPSSPRS